MSLEWVTFHLRPEPAWKNAVIYEIHPRSFQDTNQTASAI
jgi:pullulanase/glycogen debranching enzyme